MDIEPVKKILRFTKIEHTAFSIPLIFSGAWMGAGGRPPSTMVLAFILSAAIGARICGMSFNRIFDRNIDAVNPRTADRELPSGSMAVSSALKIAGAGLFVYVASCFFLGGWCLVLSPIPIIPLIGYSLLKRITWLCHFGIGLCLAIAPLGAFVAASGGIAFDGPIILFSFFVFFWMSGADIIYAVMDIDSDRKHHIYSLPARLGSAWAQRTAAMVHGMAVSCMILILVIINAGPAAWSAMAIAGLIFILMYVPQIPLPFRFFPISTFAGITGAMVPILG
ncbi:MAG: 4-hydroxybenzoate octaprenyltransferase [Desulfobacteraceae bacterium]|nr:4-hydroxybenzoate octaprenyltransferase [Desulfobacteraceae bacterium]